MQIDQETLFIEAVGFCNLNCRYCYTKKNDIILNANKIIQFIQRIQSIHPIKNILWIGRGEITLYPNLSEMINMIMDQFPEIFHCFQTNGMIITPFLRLKKREYFSVYFSIDGLEEDHDWNRGIGTFRTILKNADIIYAISQNIRIRCVITIKNIDHLIEFHTFMQNRFPKAIISYLLPISDDVDHIYSKANNGEWQKPNIPIEIKYALLEKIKQYESILTIEHCLYGDERQLAIDVNGVIYNCCDSLISIGNMDSKIDILFKRLLDDSECNPCKFKPLCMQNKGLFSNLELLKEKICHDQLH